jgi:drug/metabolite transporter (DMT)-like permease
VTRVPPYVRLLALGLIWGTSFLFIKVALEGLPPLGIALGRSVFGALTMWALVAYGRLPLPRSRVLWGHIAVVAVVSNVVPFFLFSWGELHVTSGVAGIYNATTPLATLLVAMAALPDERPTVARVSGVLLGIAGIVLVLGPWRGLGENSLLGQLACLVASASYGVAFNYVRRYVTPYRLNPVALTACQLTVATLMLAVVAPLGGGDVRLTWPVVGSVFALGALGTGIAFVIYHGLIRDIGATSASLVTFVVPVVAVALGVVALGEDVTWNLFAGAVVVVLGVAIAEGRLRRRGAAAGAATGR